MSFTNPTDRQLKWAAIRKLEGRQHWWSSSRYFGLNTPSEIIARIEEMEYKLRHRAKKRGKTEFKRYHKSSRKGRGGKEWGCSYCRPAEKSYSYGTRGRITHRVFSEPLDNIVEFFGE